MKLFLTARRSIPSPSPSNKLNRPPASLQRGEPPLNTGWKMLLFSLMLLGMDCVCARANSADFNGDGQADLLFFNQATRQLTVWLMHGNTVASTHSITIAGSPIVVAAGWRLVGAGKFDPSATNRLCLLWQEANPSTRALAVWYLTGTNNTAFNTSALLSYATPNWTAKAVGDFDGDGQSDIAFSYDLDAPNAVWLMNGLTIKKGSAILQYDYKWRLTGAGDFGQADTNGVVNPTKDGKDDLILTYHDPANDQAYEGLNNYAGLWFMNGTNFTATKIIQEVVETNAYNLLLPSPDWRFVASGDYNTNGHTDAFIRDAVIGRHGIWHLSGHQFHSGIFLQPEPDPAWKLYSQDWHQSTWRHKDIYPTITATSQTSPVQHTLNFRIKPFTNTSGVVTGQTIKRRVAGGSTWTTLVTNHTSTNYTDNSGSLAAGTRYEYEVSRDSAGFDTRYWARIFASASQHATNMMNRGTIAVVVDQQIYPSIGSGLKMFTNDLIGDGWSVVLTPAPRHLDSVGTHTNCANQSCEERGNVKPLTAGSDLTIDLVNRDNRLLVKSNLAGITNLKGVILIGHVTIPFSGHTAWDGHCNHVGAWPADAWYGYTGSGWTNDSLTLQSCVAPWSPWNRNVANDGKLDASTMPNRADFTAFVGRIDFARLPIFGTGNTTNSAEINLINGYLAKNHACRTNTLIFDGKVVAYSTFSRRFKLPLSVQDGEIRYQDDGAYVSAFRHLSPLVGSGVDKFVVGHAFHQKSDSFLWGYLSGFGSPVYICENQPGEQFPIEQRFLEYTTQELHDELEPKVGFYHLVGSYFADWYFTNNFMRASLALPNFGLAAVWGFDWPTFSLGLGDPLGESFVRSIQDVFLGYSAQAVKTILGDPTLRATVLPPPHSVTYNGTALAWSAPDGSGGWQYYVFSASSLNGPWTNVYSGSAANVIVTNPGYLMVRSAKPVTTGSGTFTNLSQGAFYPNPYS